ncbi:hypothetical protein IFM89_031384, partial [Coptis chinensis]
MARVTGVPISFLLSRGQSIKVLSQLLRKAKQKNLVIPSVKKQGFGDNTFEGATISLFCPCYCFQYMVLEAKTGFYEKPITTLDFTSLYPSIMMAYNLCYCNLVTPRGCRKFNLPPKCVNKTPSSETFVKSNLEVRRVVVMSNSDDTRPEKVVVESVRGESSVEKESSEYVVEVDVTDKESSLSSIPPRVVDKLVVKSFGDLKLRYSINVTDLEIHEIGKDVNVFSKEFVPR